MTGEGEGVACVVPAEIQELDSNMQYLVYENHSKFIKASETIREVGEPLLSACNFTSAADEG